MKLYELISALTTTGTIFITDTEAHLCIEFKKYSEALLWTAMHKKYKNRTVHHLNPHISHDGDIHVSTTIVLEAE